MLFAPLREDQVRLLHRNFKDIAHEKRLKIVELLLAKGEMHVTELQEQLELDQALVSHHLKLLLRSRFLLIRREGKFSYYRVNQDKLLRLMTALHFLKGRSA